MQIKTNEINYHDILKQYLQETAARLTEDASVQEYLNYALKASGKYIRPIIFYKILASHHVDFKNYLSIGAAIEMIHTYSLIHDDLPAMDDDDYRRGQLTLHKKYDEAVAILTGDLLLTHAFSEITNNGNLTADLKIELINLLIKAAGSDEGMILGQFLDLKNNVKSINDVKRIHNLKTGKMMILPFLMAGTILKIDNQKMDEWQNYAEKLGLLFQMQDDWLDYYGDSNITGKATMSDLHKITYASFYSKSELEFEINKLYEQLKLFPEFDAITEAIYKREG